MSATIHRAPDADASDLAQRISAAMRRPARSRRAVAWPTHREKRNRRRARHRERSRLASRAAR